MKFSHKDALWYVATISLAAAIGAVLYVRAPASGPSRPIESAYYVWQMQWNDAVRDAVRVADSSATAFMVLIGEVNASGGELRLQRGYPDWNTLAKARSPVTIVLRANAALGDLLQSADRGNAAAFVANAFDAAIAEANAKGATVRGVQLDYDCPSAKLASYRTLVDALRPRFAQLEFSITALPTWLKWGDFGGLVRGLTYYVLQVHSLDPPRSFDSPIVLCDTSRIPGYLRRATSIEVPYYLALPTYGYRFVFDDKGMFTSIIAEGPAPDLKPGYRVRTVTTDPADIARVVRATRRQPPYQLLGFVWFRLPVASDDLNWPWPTLEAVREGRTPKTMLAAELRNSGAGLYELYIANTGESAPAQVRTAVHYAPGTVLTSDTHNGFKAAYSAGTTTLSGPAPRPGGTILAAWFRVQASRQDGPAPIVADLVEITDENLQATR